MTATSVFFCKIRKEAAPGSGDRNKGVSTMTAERNGFFARWYADVCENNEVGKNKLLTPSKNAKKSLFNPLRQGEPRIKVLKLKENQ